MKLHRILGPAPVIAALLLVSVSLLAGCGKPALSGKALDGVVLDAITLQPVPDAMVLIKWRGTLPTIHSNSVPCYHVELAKTDVNGRYHTNAWFIWTKDYAPWVAHINPTGPIEAAIYKRGYAMPPRHQSDITRILVDPFNGTTRRRLSYLVGPFDRDISCDADDKSLIPIYQAAYEEGKSSAQSSDEVELADTLLTGLEAAQFGNSIALGRKGTRRELRAQEQRTREEK